MDFVIFKFIVVTLLFLSLCVGSVEAGGKKKNRKTTAALQKKINPAVPSLPPRHFMAPPRHFMAFVYTTIYIKSDKYYLVDLDGANLSIEKLKKFCGINAVGLISEHQTVKAVNGLLTNSKHWHPFCPYECLVKPKIQNDAEMPETQTSLPSEVDSNSRGPDVSAILPKPDVRVDQLRHLVETLGEVACDLIDYEDKTAWEVTKAPVTVTIWKQGKNTLSTKPPHRRIAESLKTRRNQIAHEGKRIRDQADPTTKLMEVMEEVVKIYRHLVCTGRGNIANFYISYEQVMDLVENGLGFPTTVPQSETLEKIIRACFGGDARIHQVCKM